MTQTQSVTQRVTKARIALFLDHPWFGQLALKLRMSEAPGLGTMATDATHLFYDPKFIETLTDPQLIGCIAHEVLHCALLHPFRKAHRDYVKFNMACDYAINPSILEAGMQLPPGILNDPQYAGMSAEQIYARLPDPAKDKDGKSAIPQYGIGPDVMDPPKPEPKQGRGKAQPGDSGDQSPGAGVDPGDPADGGTAESDGPITEADWQIEVEKATLTTHKAGKVPAGIRRMVEKARESRTDWRAILHRFVEQTVPSDYSWSRPNRRHISDGLYLPGVTKENFPKLGIGIDTSGSVSAHDLAVYSAELDHIMRELRPACLEVVYCDSAIPKGGVETFDPDGPRVVLKPLGGGGTAFQPVFDHFNAQSEPPAAVIYFTDLYGPAPTQPAYPVLWVTGEGSLVDAPFGELVRVPA